MSNENEVAIKVWLDPTDQENIDCLTMSMMEGEEDGERYKYGRLEIYQAHGNVKFVYDEPFNDLHKLKVIRAYIDRFVEWAEEKNE